MFIYQFFLGWLVFTLLPDDSSKFGKIVPPNGDFILFNSFLNKALTLSNCNSGICGSNNARALKLKNMETTDLSNISNDFKFQGEYFLNNSLSDAQVLKKDGTWWSNSTSIGTQSFNNCNSGTSDSGSSNGVVGNANFKNRKFLENSNSSCNETNHVLCACVDTELPEIAPGKLSQGSYQLPARIFTQPCQQWCIGGGTSEQDSSRAGLQDVMPDQYGVCDMMMGSACQSMQADGWFNKNINNPDIIDLADNNFLDIFTNGKGQFTDSNDTTYTMASSQGNLDNRGGESIKDSCGCFLMGSKCEDGNCSYFYCGAGTDAVDGPPEVEIKFN